MSLSNHEAGLARSPFDRLRARARGGTARLRFKILEL
jgi:hypothetical protein